MGEIYLAAIIWIAVVICGILANEEHIYNMLEAASAGIKRPNFHKRARVWSNVVLVWPVVTLFTGFICWSAVVYAVSDSRLHIRYHGIIAYGSIGFMFLTASAAKRFRTWRHVRMLHPEPPAAQSDDEEPSADKPQDKKDGPQG